MKSCNYLNGFEIKKGLFFMIKYKLRKQGYDYEATIISMYNNRNFFINDSVEIRLLLFGEVGLVPPLNLSWIGFCIHIRKLKN